ncbi:MAG: hypothetical protein QXU83_07110, partial [Candidatus Bathyarchaeia archaeon]
IKIKDVKDIPYDALLDTYRKIHAEEEFELIMKHINKLKDKNIERVIEYFNECENQLLKILLNKFKEKELEKIYDEIVENTIIVFMYVMKKNKKGFTKEELKNLASLIDSPEALEKGLVDKDDAAYFIASYEKCYHEAIWKMIKKRSSENEIDQAILNAVNIANKMVIK